MFAGFHKLGIEQNLEDNMRADVILDGEPVRCRSYTIRQSVDEIPTIQLELFGYGRFHGEKTKVELSASEVSDLCRIMTKENLETVVAFWNSFHRASLELVDTTAEGNATTKISGQNA